MDLNNLLLRKVAVDHTRPLLVSDNCVVAVRRCFPALKDRKAVDVTRKVLRLVKKGILDTHVFENPKKTSQLLVFAQIEARPTWFILDPSGDDGVLVVVSVRLHKEKDYGDELEEVNKE